MRYFLGIDIGTSGAKAVLMAENGDIAGVSIREYDIIKKRADYAEQSMEILWQATAEAIRELVQGLPELKYKISGIGYSGQMHGLVMIDKSKAEVRDAIIWADGRSSDAIDSIYSIVPRDIYNAITLNSLSTGFLISSLMWLKKNEPESLDRAFKLMLPKDYIRYKMCGELGTDMSDASGSLIFDTAKRQWAWELIDCLGFDRGLFVDCYESTEIAGMTNEYCSELTGLPTGIPIVYGGGDTPVQAVGNGVTGSGIAISNIGTASQLLTAENSAFYDRAYRTNTFCHADGAGWLIMGANLSGGIALKWLKNNILNMQGYDDMTRLAGKSPAGSRGLWFLPYLNGERTPYNDPKARGMFFGLGLDTDRSDMIRSAMEGIIYAQKSSLDIFKSMGVSFSRVIASGGGARSVVFRQIIADMMNCEVVTGRGEEQAGLGAAILAAVGVGAYSDVKEACEAIVRFEPEITEPIKENCRIYDEGFELYKQLYPINKELFNYVR